MQPQTADIETTGYQREKRRISVSNPDADDPVVTLPLDPPHDSISGLRRQLRRISESLRFGARSSLARRFVTIVFLFSMAMAVSLTVVQLVLDHRNQVAALEDSVLRAERTVSPSLVQSVRLGDGNLIQSHLEGLVQIDGVVQAELRAENGATSIAGGLERVFDAEYKFELVRDLSGPQVTLGLLVMRVSYDTIEKRIGQLAVQTLLKNALQALLLSAFVLIMYQFLVGRHLYELARYAASYDPDAAPRPVRLDRKPVRRGNVDELAMLEVALSDWARANHAYVSKLRSNAREQAEFNYAISHDLKSPINTVTMLLGALRDFGGDQLGEDAMEIIDGLDRTSYRMAQLIEDVFEYSHTIGEDFTTTEVDLRAEVADVMHGLSNEIVSSGAEVLVGDLPQVEGNAVQLRLLLQNMISNALKFRAKDRTPRVEIGVSDAEDGWIAFHVRDNGIGIQPDHFDKIFGLFQRLHTRDSYEGTGIGLTTCQRIVANHHGRIEVASTFGTGSTFTVFLPNRDFLF